MQRTDDNVRFDDRLATVLRIDAGTPSGRLAIWYQLTAMLGQSGHELSEPEAARSLAAIAMLSPDVPVAARVAAARAMAARCTHAPLAVLLSRDVPAVVSALFDRLNLPEADWTLILPDLTPLARSRLRARTDLPAVVYRNLASLSSSDFALSASPEALQNAVVIRATAPGKAQVGSPIAELVQRIEAYRNRRPANDSAGPTPDDTLLFSADADGLVRMVTVSPRGLFVGVSLADIAQSGMTGVDAGVAAAFGKRDHIVAGRLLLAGGSRWSGLWAVHAEPRFDSATGRFTGYRGTLSRDLGEGSGSADIPSVTADRQLASAMQQMTHELRSPLNAISGFAQLIAGQYFGPVADNYRTIATRIVNDATFLTGAFEDIDLASRLDTGRFVAAKPHCDLEQLLELLGSDGPTTPIGCDDVPLAVGCADAQRLLRLVAHPSLQSDEMPSTALTNMSVGPTTVEFTFERPANQTVDAEPDTISLDIAGRLAATLGCSLLTDGRKAIVNLPRLLVTRDRADIAG